MKPSTGSLFKAIERFEKTAYVIRVLSVDEAGGLLTVDDFVKMTVKESVFNVKLMNWPSIRYGERKNNANGFWFDDGTKGFIKVNTRLLGEAPDYPTSLVPS